MPFWELLQNDFTAALFEVGLQILLLLEHRLGGGNSRAESADGLEVLKGPLTVEGDVLELQIARGGPLGPGRGIVEDHESNYCQQDGDSSPSVVDPAGSSRRSRLGRTGGSRFHD